MGLPDLPAFPLAVILLLLTGGCVNQQGVPEAPGTVFVSNENRSGIIERNETWSGTMLITGDFDVGEGVTLSITPGTKVIFTANRDDRGSGDSGHIIDELTRYDPTSSDEYARTHVHFSVHGRLEAVGTPEERIIFTSDADEPYNTDWDGMTFHPGSSGLLEHCIIEYTHFGPGAYGTDDLNVSYCEIRHTFWGGLHAFMGSPVFEHNVLDDIGHEAFDTHKADPVIRHNNISHTRVALVFNNHNQETGNPVRFENNIIRDSSQMAQLQENAYAVIRYNTFIGSDDTGGPWHYKGFTLDTENHSQGIALADNVNVEISGNTFTGIAPPAIRYELVGPNMGIGHTTSVPETFEIGDNPVKILVSGNSFDDIADEQHLENLTESWENVEVSGNSFG